MEKNRLRLVSGGIISCLKTGNLPNTIYSRTDDMVTFVKPVLYVESGMM